MTRYRRDGTPYPDGNAGLLEWARDFENWGLRRIGETTLPNGCYVSTVWLGLNHRFDPGPPLIFETMVFQDGESVDMERYSTEALALAGHERMVTKWSS